MFEKLLFWILLGLIAVCTASSNDDNPWGDWQFIISTNTKCDVVRIRNNCTGEYLCKSGHEWEYRPCSDPSLYETWSSWECQPQPQAEDCLLKRHRTCATEFLHICDNIKKDNQRVEQIDSWTDLKSCPCNNVNIDIGDSFNVTTWSGWNEWECKNLKAHCFFYRTRDNCSSSDIRNCSQKDSIQLVSLENGKSCPCTQDGSGVDSSELGSEIDNVTWQCYLTLDHCFLYLPHPCSPTDLSDCTDRNKYAVFDLEPKQKCPCKDLAALNTTGQPELSNSDNWSDWNCQWKDNYCYKFRTRTCSLAKESTNCTYNDRVQVSIIDDNETCTCLPGYQVSTTQPPDIPIVVSWLSWGRWECHSESSSCTMVRFRECSVKSFVFCNTTNSSEFELQKCDADSCLSSSSKSTTVSTQRTMMSTSSTTSVPTSVTWGSWGKWLCTEDGGNCSMTRSRNCTDRVCKIVNDTETQDCIDDVCHAHWETWSNWRCHSVDQGICLMIRQRNCSSGSVVDCGESAKASELVPCAKSICPKLLSQQMSGKCNAYKDDVHNCIDRSESCANLNSTLDACNNTEIAATICPRSCECCDNEMEGVPVWEKWSTWKCKLVPVSKCVMHRTRRCSTGKTADCTGQADVEATCTADVCPEIYDLKVNCSHADKHNCDEWHLNCAPFTTVLSSFRTLCTDPVSIRLCPLTCGCCDNKNSTTTEQPTTPTSSLQPTTAQVTTVSPSPTTTFPSQTYTSLMYTNSTTTSATVTPSSVTLSPTYRPTTTVVSSSTLETVQKWSYWYCKTVDYGRCVMYQNNTCSTEESQDCDQSKTNTNELHCDPDICPDQYAVEKSGKCSKYNSSKCEDTVTSCESLKEENQACYNPDVVELCSKTCGCCGNENRGIVPWEAWSEWKCVLLLAPHMRCEMSRNRICASGNLSDCTGEYQEKYDSCNQDLCHVPAHVKVDCSATDNCVDDPQCPSLSFNLESLCQDVYSAAKCPQVCGCCCNSTNNACEPVTQTTELLTISPTQVGTTTIGQNTSPSTTKSETGVKATTAVSQSNATPSSASPYETSSLSTTGTTESTTYYSGNLTDLTTSSNNTHNTDSSVSTLSTTSSDIPPASTAMSTTSATTSNQGVASIKTEPVFATSSISKPTGVTSSQLLTSTAKSSFSQSQPTPISVTSGETQTLSSTTQVSLSSAYATTTAHSLGSLKSTAASSVNSSDQTSASHVPIQSTLASSVNYSDHTSASPVPTQSTPVSSVNNSYHSTASPMPTQSTPVSSVNNSDHSSPSLAPTQSPSTNTSATNSPEQISTTPGHSDGTKTPPSTSPTVGDTTTTTTSKLTKPPEPDTVATTTTTTTTAKPPQTTAPVAQTTHKIPYTIPPKTTNCAKCVGPEILCEKLYEVQPCDYPDNYCINKIVNHNDGTRSVTRSCGNFDTCYKDWFLGSSDIDKCRLFEDNNFVTLKFDCTFCCTKDGCNVPLRPASDTMYKDL